MSSEANKPEPTDSEPPRVPWHPLMTDPVEALKFLMSQPLPQLPPPFPQQRSEPDYRDN